MSQRSDIEKASQNVSGLNKVANLLGYKPEFGTTLENFFNDNPGACEAVIEWVLEHGCNRDGTDLDEDSEDDEDCDESDEEFLDPRNQR